MKDLFTFFSIILMLSININAQEPIDTDGNGYRNISTLEELRWISENDSSWSWNFEMDNDIDASDTRNWNFGDHDENPATPDSAMGWKPIGNWKVAFTGTVNGNGYSIENLYSNRPEESNIAFIGMNKNMNLYNLKITDCNFTGGFVVSSIVSYNAVNSTIKFCGATGSVRGKESIAGFVSQNFGYIRDCYTQVNVDGESYIAGFVEVNYGEVERCYSTGRLLTEDYYGGFTFTNSGEINNCFWDIESSGVNTSNGGEGKTTSEMKIKTTYTEAGWNFDFIWDIDAYYPYLIFYNSIISNSPKDDDGDGYINIKNIKDLRWLSDTDLYLNKNFEFDNDIDASETKNWENGWSPIGNEENPFTGNINGNGFSINNMFIDKQESDYVGFIGYSESQLIENISFKNIDVTGRNFTGGLVGYIDQHSGNIFECKIQGKISGKNQVGFVAGYSDIDTLINCNSSGEIYGNSYVGGLIGEAEYIRMMQNCFSQVEVNALGDYVGGIAGNASCAINNCYSMGKINATGDYIGGLCGYILREITKSYSEMNIKGKINVGGIAGTNYATIDSCYFKGTINATSNAGGLVGYNEFIIRNSYAEGIIIGTNKCIGGLCGLMFNYTNDCKLYIKNSYSKMNVKGIHYVGGLVGSNRIGHITMSFSEGVVQGDTTVGGLAGTNSGIITHSYSHSEVTGNIYVGGLIGFTTKSTQNISKIYDCYSTGKVRGNKNVGGLIGFNYNEKVSGFWDIETSSIDVSAGGEGKTTNEMKDINTYQYWNFNLIWDIVGDYPFLNYRYDNKPQDTDDDGYLNIKSLDDLRWLSESEIGLDEKWELDNDIDAAETQYWNGGEGFNPIAKRLNGSDCVQNSFSGIFKGNGNTISNLHINRKDQSYIGLFSKLKGSVKNLNIKNCQINGINSIGGIAGLSYRVAGWFDKRYHFLLPPNKIVNCSVNGKIQGNSYVGGIAGEAENTNVKLCITDILIDGNENIGGVVGIYNFDGDLDEYINSIKFSGSKGMVTGNKFVGGLVGRCQKPVIACYSQTDVKGSSYVGGLIGHLSSYVAGCYSSGLVVADSISGGLIGYNIDTDNIHGSFWDKQTSGNNYSNDGTPKSTEELFDKELFLSEGWNFDFIWDIDDGYPFINFKEEMRPEDTDGNGYLNIKTLTDLRWLSETELDLDKNWELDNDIDAAETKKWNSGFGFEPIGDSINICNGNINGNGHIIDSLHIYCPYELFVGFVSVANNIISNIALENCDIISHQNNRQVAGLVSWMYSGEINNSYVTGKLSSDNIGDNTSLTGLVSLLYNGSNNFNAIHVNNCYTNCLITTQNSGDYAGCIGYNFNGIINKCYSLGKIDAPNGEVSGFVHSNSGIINNSFSRTELNGNYIGGFAITSDYEDVMNINNCYFAGKIQTDFYAGGLVSRTSFPDTPPYEFDTSFWDSELSGIGFSYGGTPKNTAEMKTKSTFTDVGWDFENIWYISSEVNDGYPFFIGMDSIPSAVAERLISDSDILIYPNPAEDYIEITINKPSEGLEPSEGSEIEIYDVLGNMVISTEDTERSRSAEVGNGGTFSGYFNYAQQPLRIDISHLRKGVYFVKIGDKVEKFVKK